MAEAVIDRFATRVELGEGDHLGTVAAVLPVHLSQRPNELRLLRSVVRGLREPPVNEVIKARELAQSVLTAELVEARDAAFAIANQVEGCHIDNLLRTFQAAHLKG